MSEYMNVNQKFWNEAVSFHARSKFYDLKEFKKTRNSIFTMPYMLISKKKQNPKSKYGQKVVDVNMTIDVADSRAYNT